jgi:hypothetical protein
MRAHGLQKIEPLWKAEYEHKLCQTLASRIGTGELGEAVLTAKTPSEAAARMTGEISRIYYLYYSDGTNPAQVAAELSSCQRSSMRNQVTCIRCRLCRTILHTGRAGKTFLNITTFHRRGQLARVVQMW